MLRIIAIILGISLLMRLLSQSNIKKLADLVFDLILNFIAYLLTLDWLEGWVFSAIVKYYIEVFIEALNLSTLQKVEILEKFGRLRCPYSQRVVQTPIIPCNLYCFGNT